MTQHRPGHPLCLALLRRLHSTPSFPAQTSQPRSISSLRALDVRILAHQRLLHRSRHACSAGPRDDSKPVQTSFQALQCFSGSVCLRRSPCSFATISFLLRFPFPSPFPSPFPDPSRYSSSAAHPHPHRSHKPLSIRPSQSRACVTLNNEALAHWRSLTRRTGAP